MSHQEAFESLAGYALNALSEAERVEIDEHLATCAECRKELSALLDGASVLAGDPPARPQRRKVPSWAALLWAATFVLLIGALWAVRDLHVQLDDAHRAETALRESVTTLRAQAEDANGALSLLVDPTSRTVPLSGSPSTGNTRLIFVPGQNHATLVARLKALPPDSVYQLWLIAGKTPVPAGVFRAGVDPSVIAVDADCARFGVAAITVEPGPRGSAAPTTKPLLAAKL